MDNEKIIQIVDEILDKYTDFLGKKNKELVLEELKEKLN